MRLRATAVQQTNKGDSLLKLVDPLRCEGFLKGFFIGPLLDRRKVFDQFGDNKSKHVGRMTRPQVSLMERFFRSKGKTTSNIANADSMQYRGS